MHHPWVDPAITPRMSAYTVSKHGVQALSECLYLECADRFPQISVSVLNPAEVATRIFDDMPVHAGNDEDAEFYRGRIRQHGMPPRQVGAQVFDGIARGRFWILPHREVFARMANDRAAKLSGLLRPDGSTDR